jgi:two-component system LytT family response regulator
MTSPLRILIVDDEAPARRKLIRLLGAIDGVVVAGEAASGREAVERIGALAPDLVLLDIQMPVLDGFGVIEAFGVDAMPPVVFVTAHDEHALRAFEVHALDYLLKPIAASRLERVIGRVRRQRATQGDRTAAASDAARRHGQLRELVAEQGRLLRRVLVQDDRGARLLPVETIELARAERNYVTLQSSQGTFRMRGTLGALIERLDPALFLQVNRSDVVRLDAIRELQPWSHGDYRIVMRDGQAMLWSRRFRARQGGQFTIE